MGVPVDAARDDVLAGGIDRDVGGGLEVGCQRGRTGLQDSDNGVVIDQDIEKLAAVGETTVPPWMNVVGTSGSFRGRVQGSIRAL